MSLSARTFEEGHVSYAYCLGRRNSQRAMERSSRSMRLPQHAGLGGERGIQTQSSQRCISARDFVAWLNSRSSSW